MINVKYCPYCGEKLEEGALFCTNCGAKITNDEATTAENVPTNETTADASESIEENPTTEPNVQFADTLEYTKRAIQENGYFNYVKNTIKRPTSMLQSENTYYGWIHIVILSFIFTLSIYFLIRGIIFISARELGMGYPFDPGVEEAAIRLIRDALIPRLFLVSFITYLIYPLSAFIILKLMVKSEETFNHVLSRMGGLLTPSILILAFSSLISLLFRMESMLVFSTILILATVTLINIAYNYFLFIKFRKIKLDKFYAIFLGNLLLSFLSSILFYVQMDAFRGIIQEIMYYI